MTNKNHAILHHVGFLSPSASSYSRPLALTLALLFALFTWQTIPRWFFDQLDKRRGGGPIHAPEKRVTTSTVG